MLQFVIDVVDIFDLCHGKKTTNTRRCRFPIGGLGKVKNLQLRVL